MCVAADGAACSTYMDCASGYCDDSTYLCGTSPPSPPMSTGVATGSSVDMPAGSFCYYDAECASSVCTFNMCQGKPDGDPCTNAAECSSYQCTLSVCGTANQLEDGQPCSIETDCRSYFCTNGICGLAQQGSMRLRLRLRIDVLPFGPDLWSAIFGPHKSTGWSDMLLLHRMRLRSLCQWRLRTSAGRFVLPNRFGLRIERLVCCSTRRTL